MVLKVDINSCEIIDWRTNTGEYNARTLQVEMCEEMRVCAMAFVTFELADGTIYESLIKDGKAEIPLFKIPQFVKVGAYSADIEGDKITKRYSPTPCYDYVNPGSYSSNSEEPPLPTPSMLEELMKKAENAVSKDNIVQGNVYINEKYEDDEVFSANSVAKSFKVADEKVTDIDERLQVLEDDYKQAFTLIGGAE